MTINLNLYLKLFCFLSAMIMISCTSHWHKIDLKVNSIETRETIHGYSVSDPFRSLENIESANSWLENQNKNADLFFKKKNKYVIAKRLRELQSVRQIYGVKPMNGWLIYYKREMDQELFSLYLNDGKSETLLFDPESLNTGEKSTIDWYKPDRTGKFIAIGISKGGNENSTLYIMDVQTKTLLTETIPDTGSASVAWLPDSSGFYYTRFPDPEKMNRSVYFHLVGTSPESDKIIFERAGANIFWPTLSLSGDGNYLSIMAETGFTNIDLYFISLKTMSLIDVGVGLNALTDNIYKKENLFLARTDYKSPNGRIVAIDPLKSAPENWHTVIEEPKNMVVKSFVVFKNRLFVHLKRKGVSSIVEYNMKGEVVQEALLPALGLVSSFNVDLNKRRLVFTFGSLIMPTDLFAIDLSDKTLTANPLLDQNMLAARAELVIEEVEYPSFDGTIVPMLLVHRKDITPDSDTPTILLGYGSYGISWPLAYMADLVLWTERGGLWAIPSIRGGGVYGKDWHQDGMKENKFKSFKDFEYAMRYLIRNNFTSVDRLAIQGSSGGGLIVGAMMTQAPYLFSCACSIAGFFDMIRMVEYISGDVHASEFGDSRSPDEIGYVLGFSPYHQIVDGVNYPAFLAQAMENDTRVPWMHSAKFVARLQEANSSEHPVLLRLVKDAGHGAGMTTAQILQSYEEELVFIMNSIGDPAKRDK